MAFVDLFDHDIKNSGDWKTIVEKYLFSGKKPLANGILGGREFINACENVYDKVSRRLLTR